MFWYFIVRGNSMEPSAKEGDFVFAHKLFFSPQKGNLVVLKDPTGNRFLLKKIEEIRGEMCWVVGENESISKDSRHFGWVPKTMLLGRAFIIHR